jgi:polysaccharide export outer membrane protein
VAEKAANLEDAMRSVAIAIAISLLLAGCAGTSLAGADAPRGADAYTAIAPSPSQAVDRDYRIGPQDALTVSVFQEPELSTPTNAPLQVNASGNITMPLIGTLHAAGKTAAELSAEIASRLSANYLRNPQVTVGVTASVSQKVVVQGEVNEAGVFDVKGRTTLLEALSLAKGETRVAALSDVIVFRNINGQRMAALFDVAQIRKGIAEDPEILGNDVVVVGTSKSRSIWRDILAASPLLNTAGIFRRY